MAKAKRSKVTKIDILTEDLNRRIKQAAYKLAATKKSPLDHDLAEQSLPLSPAVELEAKRQGFGEGNKLALVDAIRICAKHDLPLPAWVSREFLFAYDCVLNLEIATWDDVLGTPRQVAKHLVKKKKEQFDSARVLLALMQARQVGRSISGVLFEEIGERYGLGKTRVSDIYYGKPKRKNPVANQSSGEFRGKAKTLRYKKR